MPRRCDYLIGTVLSALAGVLLLIPTPTAAKDIGYVEDFALAQDRAAALKQLIPGTDDFYYYHALHYLNTEQFDRIEPLTKLWYERHKQTARLTEIQTRYALLTFDKDPKKTLEYVRHRLGIHFSHQKEQAAEIAHLPGALDQKLIARETLKRDSLARWGNLHNFEDTSLDWMAAEALSWEQRRELLSRLTRPDIGNLPKLVADDLAAPHPQSFGAYTIHKQMTLAQLDELLKLRPALLNESAFVTIYLTKLHPGEDDNWKRDRPTTLAFLSRLQAFVDRLAPVHNSLKAHVLYHRLAFDRAQGVFDKERFLAYLKLPRFQPYMAKEWLDRDESKRHPADLNADYSPATLLPPVHVDEPLVRSYLAHYFLTATGYAEFEPYVNDVYLKHLFAETKLVHGLGVAEEWASKLPPELLQQIKDRVDIDFAFTNKTDFAVDEPIHMEVFVKNAPSLLLKVYEVNTKGFYRTHQREVDTDINLDGLVPNAERVIPTGNDPFRRVSLTIDLPDPKGQPNFPEANRPGVYVIDLIGNGKSSRALIRKGRLYPVVSTGTAGQVVRVVDEKKKPVTDATVWVAGQEYAMDKDGAAIVPFSTNPGRRPVVLSRGEFASLDYLDHPAENFHFTAGIHVDRESLLTQRIAPVLIRPGLTLNGKPVSIKLLEEVRTRITSTDSDGVPSSIEVPNFKLFEDRESLQDVRVPPRLAALTVAITAKVRALSTGKLIDLAVSQTFAVNGIDKTDKIEDLHLAKFGDEYVIELLGRTGEAKPDRPVQVAIKHRDFKEPVRATLKSDLKGRVTLGPLVDIASVTATNPDGVSHTWPLSTDRHTYRHLIHVKAGDAVRVPYLGKLDKPSRDELALFEVRGGDIRADKFEAVSISNGMIELKGLAPNDYELWLKRQGEKVRVRVAAGEEQNGYLFGAVRHLQLPGLKPIQIETLAADKDNLTIQLRDASKYARVHVFATRYQPAFSAFHNLAKVGDIDPAGLYPLHADSLYLAGRNIGDEYRYVLGRRAQKKYPGNLLERPQLLLNPWAVRQTETGEQLAEAGEEYKQRGGVTPPATTPPAPGAPHPEPNVPPGAGGEFADLDFLYDASAVGVNLLPDKDGVVKLTRKELGPHAMIHVVAVDPLGTTARSITLPEVPANFVDLRLRNGLSPDRHYTQQKQVTIAEGAKLFQIPDVAASRFEIYDSLAKVYALYATLSKDPKLAEFAFLLRWPKMKVEEKRTHYSKHACHELHFFLMQKDPEFFNTVVRPYLANKKDKTFLDHWLLGDDLTHYTQPWEYHRLNVPERVLLGRRIANEPAKTVRHISDMLKLLPPSIDRDLFLFSVAVENSALETPTVGGASVVNPPVPPKVLPTTDPRSGEPKPEQPADKPGGFPGAGAGVPAGPGGPPAKGMPARPGDSSPKRDGYSEKGGKDMKEEGESKTPGEQDGKKATEREDRFHQDDREKGKLRQLYRKLDPTMEWAENNYYKLLIQQQLADLVPVSPFWADYARHADGQFLTKHLAAASRNFTEMMFALSVLDLPFEPAKHEVKFENGALSLIPGGKVIAFHEEVRPAAEPPAQLPILISQNFYRHGDRFKEEAGEKVDKFVTDEFVVHTVYGCQVVVTNPTSSRQKLSVLVELPVGSVPLANGRYTRSVSLDLQPFHTQTIDYFFYFPRPGEFKHFPVHVAKNEQHVAAAKPVEFHVVAKPSKLDTTTWDYVSQNGSNEEVLAFLNRENVRALNLDKIAFRLRDRAFFESVVALLQQRHLYHPTTYSYAIHHADVAVARQYLLHADAFVNETGGPIESPLLVIDPVSRHQYEHLEYKPLVNARAHALGKRRQIVNDRFHEQYHRFLKTLTYHKSLDDTDLVAVTYYLLLQDRIDEAFETFARVVRDRLPTQMQYDYCAAYLEMFKEDPRAARSIATKYLSHPVDRWRNTFTAIVAQLDEIEGKGPQVVDRDDRNQQQGQLAATEPGFEVALDGKAVALTYQNLESVRVNYYPMDVELLFSTSPFVQQSGGQFASIRPNATADVKLPKDQKSAKIPLPAEYANKNVLVEVTAAGKTRAVPYYATAMTVTLTENYGHLQTVDAGSGKGLSKVYVKVYAKLADGSVKFHKDGYTDLRGRFDYVSVNTPERQAIQRFAVLVLSEDRGALIREAGVPLR
jgi:hypothetical protein